MGERVVAELLERQLVARGFSDLDVLLVGRHLHRVRHLDVIKAAPG